MLSPYRVLDLSGPLAFLTGKIYGDLGADVIKVEPPGGDPGRMTPPYFRDRPDPARSLYWAAYNNNKRGITLDIAQPRGRELLLEAVGRSDFLIESFAPGRLEELALDYARLREVNPALIMISVTPFGQHGPYRDFRASDLEIIALSGALSLAGEPEGTPVRVSIPQSPVWAAAEAAMAGLIALHYRRISGKGQHVDVSAQMAATSMLAHAPAFWDVLGISPSRAGVFITGRNIHGAKMKAFWPVRDGWVNFILYGGVAGLKTNRGLVAWMEARGGAPPFLREMDWKKFDVTQATQAEIGEIEQAVGRFLSQLSKKEFLEGVTEREMLGYPVSTPKDIYDDPQLEARGFWQTVRDERLGGEIRMPGPFARFSRAKLRPPRPAPAPGEHNGEFWEGELGRTPAQVAELRAEGVI